MQKGGRTMRKFVVSFLALTLACSFIFTVHAKDLKIGYVDTIQVSNEYKKIKEYEDILTKKAETKDKELSTKRSELEKLISKAGLLKDKEKEKEEQKISQAKKDLQQFYTQARADLTKERNEKMKEIGEDVDRVIKDYGNKNGFDLILTAGAVLYTGKTINVTTDVLKILNESFKK
jgi:outer membrane protein